jgi:glutamate dehydrogenase/leucine dehydrogenase
MKEVLGPWTDIPAPDIGTDERVMAWVFDEFSKHKGFSPAVVTGKVRQATAVNLPCIRLMVLAPIH